MMDTMYSPLKDSMPLEKTKRHVPASPRSTHFTLPRALLLILLFTVYFLSPVHWLSSSVLVSHVETEAALTNLVRWDNYSMIISGQRVFLWSGEVHPWRIPVPDLWLDVLEKMKASGMNAVSVYSHWGLHNPAPGEFNFEGFLDWQLFLDAAKQVGLWVVFRPGPYINAETTGGGIPGWVIAETEGHLRSNGSAYQAAWTPYIEKISKIVEKNQITQGGPIIAVQVENEYSEKDTQGPPFKQEMMDQLLVAFRKNGVVVPLTHNDASMNFNYVDGLGAPDLYGFDSYPQGFNCSAPTVWKDMALEYDAYHHKANPTQPLYLPEIQAGAFDPWGGPGYDKCRALTNPSFQNVFYHHLIASNSRFINLYMIYGGTSWGYIPFPKVYTSYDYGSPISETRELTDKYRHIKNLGFFLRSSPSLYATDIVGSTENGTVDLTGDEVFATHLKNAKTDTSYYFVRHTDITSNATLAYQLTFSSSFGTRTIPQTFASVMLPGRSSDVVVVNYPVGHSTLYYSTATVLFAGSMDGRDVLLLYGSSIRHYEFEMAFKGIPSSLSVRNHPHILYDDLTASTIVTVLHGFKGLETIWESDKQLVLFADEEYTHNVFFPTLSFGSGPFRNYWQFGTNVTIVVGGPHLVRSAVLEGETLMLYGDLKDSARLFVAGISGITDIWWNGESILGLQSQEYGIYSGSVSPRLTVAEISVPVLKQWRYADSLPEIAADYQDKDWTVANHTSTLSRFKPMFGKIPVLYACDYGFCEGAVIWRGRFENDGSLIGGILAINGGEAFAAAERVHVGERNSTYGIGTNVNQTVGFHLFPKEALKLGENILVVLQDNMGLDETGPHYDADASRSPRGITGAQLLPSGNFTSWKVQGKLGGYSQFTDKPKGVLNTGGLFGERQGYHLPSTPYQDWLPRELELGLSHANPGVEFFKTTFELDIPDGYDVPISFVFEEPGYQSYRALLFVNGWLMGRRVASLGPQRRFPVHRGILNHQGSNVVAVALWVTEPEAVITPLLRLHVEGIYDQGDPDQMINRGTSLEMHC